MSTGKCLCGAVSYEIAQDITKIGACHCGSCRAWSGGVFIGAQAKGADVTITGEENVTRFASSDWAERAFCKNCGSSLFYRVTAPGPHHDDYHFGAGTLDDLSGAKMTEEIFIDKKPAAYAFAGDTYKMTEAEMMALFAPPPEGARA